MTDVFSCSRMNNGDIMSDADFEKRVRFGNLFDIYGGLLTEKQQHMMEQYFYEDYSLGEIAEENNISRQAVYDLLKRVEATLEKYEDKLHFLQKSEDQNFKIRAALKLLKTIDVTEPRVREVTRILQTLENGSR